MGEYRVVLIVGDTSQAYPEKLFHYTAEYGYSACTIYDIKSFDPRELVSSLAEHPAQEQHDVVLAWGDEHGESIEARNVLDFLLRKAHLLRMYSPRVLCFGKTALGNPVEIKNMHTSRPLQYFSMRRSSE